MDIDKLTQRGFQQVKVIVLVLCWILINLHRAYASARMEHGFSTLLDIDKLTPDCRWVFAVCCFSTLLDIDKLAQQAVQ